MDEVIKEMNLGIWWSLFVLIFLYLIKEIIRYIVDLFKTKNNFKSEMQYKYAEKLLDQKVPIYVEHYSYLKQAIGIYLHIVREYRDFENWDDTVYNNLQDDKQFSTIDKEEAYRKSIGYRCCENLSNYTFELENFKIKSMNAFSLNQLFVGDKLIEKSLEINIKLDKKIKELVTILKDFEQKYAMSNDAFIIYKNEQFSKINYKEFVTEIELYLEEVKKEFYNEYNVDLQNDYVKGKKRA